MISEHAECISGCGECIVGVVFSACMLCKSHPPFLSVTALLSLCILNFKLSMLWRFCPSIGLPKIEYCYKFLLTTCHWVGEPFTASVVLSYFTKSVCR